jgi:hypothetical protein
MHRRKLLQTLFYFPKLFLFYDSIIRKNETNDLKTKSWFRGTAGSVAVDETINIKPTRITYILIHIVNF